MSFRGLFRRAVQSLRLARMGLAISRAEVKRAAAASAPPSVRRAGSAPQPAQQLTPAQLQERIRELRQSLVRSEAEHQHEERAVQSSQHHHHQQQGGAAPSEKSAAEAAALDRQAEEQLAAFNARLDALAAEKEEVISHTLVTASALLLLVQTATAAAVFLVPPRSLRSRMVEPWLCFVFFVLCRAVSRRISRNCSATRATPFCRMTRLSARWAAHTVAAVPAAPVAATPKLRQQPQLQHTTNNSHNAHIAPLSHCYRHVIHV
jgi:hypothetical protein